MWTGSAQDSSRDSARIETREQEELLQLAGEGLAVLAPDGVVRWANRALAELAGAGREGLAGRTLAELGADPESASELAGIAAAGAEPVEVDVSLRGASGTVRPVRVRARAARAAGAAAVLCSVRDQSELRGAQGELRSAREALQRATDDLNSFIYAASHDLQEPLRMVVAYSQLLQRRFDGKLDEEADKFIGFAVEGARRMELLLQGLLAYCGAASDVDEPRAPVNCESVLEKVRENLEAQIKASRAEITFRDLPWIQAQEVHVVQLFQNLIGNAIKYRSDEPPRIHVAAERGEGEWSFTVRDNGRGMDPERARGVFGVFARLHGAHFSGSGMGLAICSRIVERYGGRIDVESEPGRGSTFRFTLRG